MGIELKEKKIDTSKFKFSLDETTYLQERIEESFSKQKKLGLGNSKSSVDRLLGGVKGSKAIKTLLEKGFVFIQEPDTTSFPRFQGGENATCNQSLSDKPKFAMVKLSGETQTFSCIAGNMRHTADIPMIPSTALELAERVSDIVSESGMTPEFHLILEPQWKSQPQGDPVLVCKIAEGFWVQVCAWDSDAAAIQNLLKERDVQQQ